MDYMDGIIGKLTAL